MLFNKRNRHRAWSRWLDFKSAREWLALARGDRGDFYWTPSEQYAELRRRGAVDEYGRITSRGRLAKTVSAAQPGTLAYRLVFGLNH